MESLDGNGIVCNELMTDCCAWEAAEQPVMRVSQMRGLDF